MKDKEKKVESVPVPKIPTVVPSITLDNVDIKDEPSPRDKSRSPSMSQQSRRASHDQGPMTIPGLLSSKRSGRKLARRASERRDSFFPGSVNSQASHGPQAPKMEPTYQLEPRCVFNACAVEKLMKKAVKDRLEGMAYNQSEGGRLSRLLSEEIKDRVKQLKFDRYRIVCTVTLGENKGQGVMSTSRCAWDPKIDTYATYTYTGKNIFCTTCVFGVYAE